MDKSPPRWESSTSTSEYQDCHMQLWKEENISEFKTLSKISKVILIEKHFKATCSRITSTTHSATYSKAMIRELGNVELIRVVRNYGEKYKKFSLYFLLESRNCVSALADNAWLTANPEESSNKLRLDTHSIPNYVIKKGRYSWCSTWQNRRTKKEYHMAWNAWKRCCNRVDSQGEHFTGIHDRFLRDPSVIVNHNSQSDGRNKSAKSLNELAQEDHTYRLISLQREFRKDTKDNGISPWISQAKTGLCDFDPIFELQSSLKNRLHRESCEQAAINF